MAVSLNKKEISEYISIVGEDNIKLEVNKKRFHDWFEQRCVEINAQIKQYNAEIYRNSGFKADEKHYTPDIDINRADKFDEVKGWVFLYIDFPEEPNFLLEEDKEKWNNKIDEVLNSRLKYNSSFYTSAKKESELYISHEIKEEIEQELNNIVNYIKWYSSAVKVYNSLANETKETHNKKLEDCFSNL